MYMHTYAVFTVSFYKSSHLRVNLKVGHVCTELLMPVHGQWESQVVAEWENSYLYICTYIHTLVGKVILTDSSWTEWEAGYVCLQKVAATRRADSLDVTWWRGWCLRKAVWVFCMHREVRSKNRLGNNYPYPSSFLAHTTRVQQDVHTYVRTFCQVWQGLVHREGVIVILKGLMPCTNLGLHVRMYIRIKVNTQRGQFHSFSIHMCSMYTYV